MKATSDIRGLPLNEVFSKIYFNFYSVSPWWTTTIASIGTVIAFIFGEELVGYLFISLMGLDLLTGLAKAVKCREKISSEIMGKRTFIKLMSYLLPLLVIAILSIIGLHCLGDKAKDIYIALQNFTIMWFSIREAISILENLDKTCNGNMPIIHLISKFLQGQQKQAEQKLDELCGPDNPNP